MEMENESINHPVNLRSWDIHWQEHGHHSGSTEDDVHT